MKHELFRGIALAGSILTLSYVVTPVRSQPLDQTLCRRSAASIEVYQKEQVPAGHGDVQTYMLDSDFRAPKRDVPWSETKIMEDPVTGSKIGVIDRNYIPNASRIHTYWYKDLIVAEGIEISNQTIVNRFEFDVMMIPAGDKYIVLRGCNGRFPVSQQVANALMSQPAGKNVFVKLYAEGYGGGVLNQIGSGTVAQWKKVYSNWSKPSGPRPQELGF